MVSLARGGGGFLLIFFQEWKKENITFDSIINDQNIKKNENYILNEHGICKTYPNIRCPFRFSNSFKAFSGRKKDN